MGAAALDLTIEQGTTFRRIITLKDALDVEIDLTGESFRGQIRKTPSSGTVAAVFTCTVLNQVTNKGEVEITISAANTALIPLAATSKPLLLPENFVYNIERVKVDTTVSRILEGIAIVSPEVTK